jgi:hypothetical protein
MVGIPGAGGFLDMIEQAGNVPPLDADEVALAPVRKNERSQQTLDLTSGAQFLLGDV